MPFTPFHLGPALILGLPLRRNIHLPTFLVASIIIDLEPLAVLVFGIYSYPLHGYLHTILSAVIIGILLGYIMYKLEVILEPLWNIIQLKPRVDMETGAYSLAGITGVLLHVLLDSPLYSDIKPLYPLPINPLYNPGQALNIYTACLWLGLLGLPYYIIIIITKK